MKHSEIVKNVEILPQFVADNEIYIDFEDCVIPHIKGVVDEDQTYSGWRFTLCFDGGGNLIDYYEEILLNTPDGWQDEDTSIPAEHLPGVQKALADFKVQLEKSGVPINTLKGGYKG